jgi:hypothetical protein
MLDSERAQILAILEPVVNKNLEQEIKDQREETGETSKILLANQNQANAFIKAIDY